MKDNKYERLTVIMIINDLTNQISRELKSIFQPNKI